MAGIKRTGKTTRSTSKRVSSSRSTSTRRTTSRSTSTSQRSQFVKQGKTTATTTPKAPVKKSIQRTPTQKTQPKATPTQTPTSDPWSKLSDLAPKKEAPKSKQIADDITKKVLEAPKDNGMVMDAGKKPAADEGAAGGGLFGSALNAFGLGGQDKPAPAGDQTKKPAEPAEKKESGNLFGNLLGGAKDAVVNTALEGMGLGDFKDIGLADRLTKLTPEQRGNLMDLASSLKDQEKQAGGKAIDLKQHLGKLTTEEKGKLFDLAASGKLKELMADLPRLQKAAEASKPNQQELQALQQISQMLGRDKLGGADGKFNFGDMNAIANGLMRDRGGLRQQVLSQLNAEGKRFQARVANRALSGKRGLFTRRALQQVNQQVPAEIKGQLSQGLREAQVDPQTARTYDNAPRNLTFNEMKQFEQNMQALKGMQQRLGQALGQQVVFPQGVSQEAINHTIQGALDPQADARNIDRVLQSIIHNGRVELPLPPGGVLVPHR